MSRLNCLRKIKAQAFIFLISCLARVNSNPPFDIRPYCKLGCLSKDGKHVANTICRYKCLVGKKCKELRVLPLSQEERQHMLDLHNIYRQKVASGKDTRGDNGAAANMMVLNYDIELELPAICWGMQCIWGHDQCRKTIKYPVRVGQNLYESTRTGDSSTLMAQKYLNDTMTSWYEEIKHTTKEHLDKYNGTSGETGSKIGHYTQLVWAKTTHVGCTRVCFKRYVKGVLRNVVYILCDYAPSGNYMGQPVYEFGKPASKCPSGKKGNSIYPALCGVLEKVPKEKLFPIDIGSTARVNMSKWLLTLLAFIADLGQSFENLI